MKPFHLAFKVKDIPTTRQFYAEILGCREGRSSATWYDFDFFGHQLSAHISTNIPEQDYCGQVDGVSVPIPHFGCLLSVVQFEEVKNRLEQANVSFIVKPQVRYEGQPGEQMTMFVTDFSGNPLEFKAFSDESKIFE